jgi:hypothetical protein
MKIQISPKSDKNNGYFIWRRFHIWQYLAVFFVQLEMFQIKVVEKLKPHILCSVTFFQKSYRL